jgi:3-phytase
MMPLAAVLGAALVALPLAAAPVATVHHTVATHSVEGDADDPAIWVHPTRPAASRILGTDKRAGALYAFGLDGRVLQVVRNLQRPNNVDVEQGVSFGRSSLDVAVVTERGARALRAFRIGGDGTLSDISGPGLDVFQGEPGDSGAPMGIALFRRPRDGALYAIVSRKESPTSGALWQYRLTLDPAGRMVARKVRALGTCRPESEIEAVAVDDGLGYVYYAEERVGIHKWHADPDHPEQATELALFATTGFAGDREGIAVIPLRGATGYLLCADQTPGSSSIHIFRRDGTPGAPHNHTPLVKQVRGGADSTDGIDGTSNALGPAFPRGLVVMMNSAGRNFLLYPWERLATAGHPRLATHR